MDNKSMDVTFMQKLRNNTLVLILGSVIPNFNLSLKYSITLAVKHRCMAGHIITLCPTPWL